MKGFPEIRAWDGPLTQELRRVQSGGDLGQVPEALRPDSITRTVCGFCSTGCGLDLHLREGRAVNVTPAVDSPVNRGMACPKGWAALDPLGAPDRATAPLLRGMPTDWGTAISAFVDGVSDVQRNHGPDSFAFLGTGQMPSEELAFFGALAKFGMGLRHGDGNTRQCMATAVTAYKESFGFDAPPYTYGDLEESDVIILVGSNLAITHPILWQRLLANPHHPSVVVIDPRMTETAQASTLHLALCPKSDLTLFYGVANVLIKKNAVSHEFVGAHTNGFDAFARDVSVFSADLVSNETGLPESLIEQLVDLIADGKRVSFWWTMGVNQSHEGTRVAQSLINLALLTGNIGRPGTGANSITGQCNAMGSRLFSNTSSLFGGRSFEDAGHRREVAEILGIDAHLIPDRGGDAYPEIVEGIAQGRIRGLWVVGTNPAHSWIGRSDFDELLDRLDFLVVQDMYHSTETARRAHLLLPAAGWGEKEGTFINSERRVGLIKRGCLSPGEALSDFSIFRLIAEAWGCDEMFRKWTSPEAVFSILSRLTVGRPCDLTGIDGYDFLEREGGVQWPWPESSEGRPEVERRLFSDGQFYHPDGKARFVFETPRPLPEPTDEAWPFTLLTGRGSAAQWHTQTRTSKSAVLRSLYPEAAYVEIHPEDARRLGIVSGERVAVESRRGRIYVVAFLTPCVSRMQIFIPMHYEEANRLTDPVFDPYSRQPAYKACAARLRRVPNWEAES